MPGATVGAVLAMFASTLLKTAVTPGGYFKGNPLDVRDIRTRRDFEQEGCAKMEGFRLNHMWISAEGDQISCIDTPCSSGAYVEGATTAESCGAACSSSFPVITVRRVPTEFTTRYFTLSCYFPKLCMNIDLMIQF